MDVYRSLDQKVTKKLLQDGKLLDYNDPSLSVQKSQIKNIPKADQ